MGLDVSVFVFFFFSSRRRHTRFDCDWSSECALPIFAAVSDVAHPDWRASALGVYRPWRASGYAIGALAAGPLADAFTMPFPIAASPALTFVSGAGGAGVMYETLPDRSPSWRVAPSTA